MKQPDTDEKKNLGKELKQEVLSQGYWKRARNRAQRRKSPWNLLLIPLAAAGIGLSYYAQFRMLWHVHVLIYPEHAGHFSEFWQEGIGFAAFVSSFLIAVPALFSSLVIGMMLANLAAWCVGPARRVFEREAKGVKWASFSESMATLWLVAKWVIPICLFLGFLGAATLRSLK
jgi:hypothetical protein